MKVPYKEGDWFAVPIKSGFVLARIARARSPILFGYFFKPLYPTLPSEIDTQRLTAKDAFEIAKFGHLGFVSDNWQSSSDQTLGTERNGPCPH
jgi:hypothetical protein